jgi:hypothetical protein
VRIHTGIIGLPLEFNKSHNLINCSYFLTHESREFPLSPENFLSRIGSPDGQRSIESLDIVWPMLEKADVDAKKRRII